MFLETRNFIDIEHSPILETFYTIKETLKDIQLIEWITKIKIKGKIVVM